MKLVYFGSGAFGLPTLRRLEKEHEIALVVTQPDRPAGRNRAMTATPVGEFAAQQGLPIIKPENVNDAEVVRKVLGAGADAAVVIAFGQKLGNELLGGVFMINLHGSLLPKFRGAAPIQRAIMEGERETGVSVIGVTERMDAGPVYGQAAVVIDPLETAGELHDRLSELGPDVMLEVLAKHAARRSIPQLQDERLATKAPKLSKADGTTSFDGDALAVRQRVHGLTPWPGCTIRLDGRPLRLARVQAVGGGTSHGKPGEVLADLTIACGSGAIKLLEVQPPGGKVMAFDSYRHGQPIRAGMKAEPL